MTRVVTAPWPPAELPGLHVDLGEHTRPWAPDRGVWIRPPAADYQCPTCGAVESASGDAVPAFAHTIHRTHTCTPEQARSERGCGANPPVPQPADHHPRDRLVRS